MNSKKIKLWDLPTRLFHWLLVLAVGSAVLTAQIGGNLIDVHAKLGIFIAGLLGFRLVWGLLGSTYARFAQFFPTPSSIKAYLRGEWRGEGHNPLGALSVFGLLGVLTVQVLSGLVANDDIAFVGPLFDLVGKDWSDRLTGLHHLFGDAVIALVVLHVAAIVFYVQVKKHNIVQPMVTGWKADAEGESAQGGGLVALIIALIVAAACVYGASGAWLPAPSPAAPAATTTPNW